MIITSVILISYLVGSIPFGLILSKILKRNDPRYTGSNNIGATNVARISGWKIGLLTLLLDILKGFFILEFFSSINNDFFLYSAVSVFLGHLFPVWIKFKGGKGIAVFIGILSSLSYVYAIIFLSIWLIIASLFKYSSLAALVSTLVILFFIFFDENTSNFFLVTFISLMTFFKHKENIRRLYNKEEPKINLKK